MYSLHPSVLSLTEDAIACDFLRLILRHLNYNLIEHNILETILSHPCMTENVIEKLITYRNALRTPVNNGFATTLFTSYNTFDLFDEHNYSNEKIIELFASYIYDVNTISVAFSHNKNVSINFIRNHPTTGGYNLYYNIIQGVSTVPLEKFILSSRENTWNTTILLGNKCRSIYELRKYPFYHDELFKHVNIILDFIVEFKKANAIQGCLSEYLNIITTANNAIIAKFEDECPWPTGIININGLLYFKCLASFLYSITYNVPEYASFIKKCEESITILPNKIVIHGSIEVIDSYFDTIPENEKEKYIYLFEYYCSNHEKYDSSKFFTHYFLSKHKHFVSCIPLNTKIYMLKHNKAEITLEFLMEHEFLSINEIASSTDYIISDVLDALKNIRFNSIHYFIKFVNTLSNAIMTCNLENEKENKAAKHIPKIKLLICKNIYLKLEMIENTLDSFDWSFPELSKRGDILTEAFVLKHIHRNWDISYLMSHVEAICVPFILKHFLEMLTHPDNHIMVNHFFTRPSLSEKDIDLIKTTFSSTHPTLISENTDAILQNNSHPAIINHYISKYHNNVIPFKQLGKGCDLSIVKNNGPIRWTKEQIIQSATNTYNGAYYDPELRRNLAAFRIQLAWHKCYYNPNYTVCKRRLQREYDELMEEFKTLKY